MSDRTSTTPNAEYRYFVYDPLGDGMVFFRRTEDRDAYAQNSIQACFDDSWSEEVDQIVTGEVTHSAQCLNRQERPEQLDEDGLDDEGNWWDEDWEWKGNYTLEPLPLNGPPDEQT